MQYFEERSFTDLFAWCAVCWSFAGARARVAFVVVCWR